MPTAQVQNQVATDAVIDHKGQSLAPTVSSSRAWAAALTLEAVGARSSGDEFVLAMVPFWSEVRTASGGSAELALLWEWPTSECANARIRVVGCESEHRAVSDMLIQRHAFGGSVQLSGVQDADDTAFLGISFLNSYPELFLKWVQALSSATDLHFATAAERGSLSHQERQNIVLGCVVQALQVTLGEEVPQYLSYHRDWLLRYPILQRGNGSGNVDRVFALLDEHSRRIGPRTIEELTEPVTLLTPTEWRSRWVTQVRHFVSALRNSEAALNSRFDPFARNLLFPSLFRLFHTVACQFGLSLLEEALLYHLAINAVGRETLAFSVAPHLEGIPNSPQGLLEGLSFSFEETYAWRELIALGSTEGRLWLAQYRETERYLGDDLTRALTLMRQGQLVEGERLLARVAAHRDSIEATRPGVYHVLGRFYLGEVAFLEYRRGNFDLAERELERSRACIRDAINLHEFLLPVAPMVVDIPLQKARVAKKRCDWAAVARNLATMRAMQEGIQPLCVLPDGTVVDYDLLSKHFSGYVSLEGYRNIVRRLLDVDARLQDFRRLTSQIYALPEFVSLREPLP